MTNDLKWMLACDPQIPYQDDRAVQLWFDVMDWYKPHVIDYLGDISDQFCFSRFQEGTTKEFMKALPVETQVEEFLSHIKNEEKPVADFYSKTREKRPKSEIFSALGNHDVRVFAYVDKHLPEIVDDVTPESLWGLDSLGIEYIYYEDVPKHRFGDIYVHHGISASAESGASVKSDIGNIGVSLVRGHSHRIGTYFKTYELRNETLRGYEIGHLSKVDADGFKYTQVHNWQQGFAVGLISGDNVHIQVVEITSDYECWVAGKRFKA